MPLPKCTGPFTVGCFDLMTKPKNIPTDLSPSVLCHEGTDLGLFARFYYPCKSSEENEKASWIPQISRNNYIRALLSSSGVGWLTPVVKFFTRNIVQDASLDVPIIEHSTWQSSQQYEYLKENKSLPLLVFCHGLFGTRFINSVFCTQLASEGFVVAAIEFRDGSSSATYTTDEKGDMVHVPYFNCSTQDDDNEERFQLRNMQVNKRSREVCNLLTLIETLNEQPENISNIFSSQFDLKSLQGRIDTSQPLLMGHSFGGATILNCINKDNRFKRGIGLDVWFPPLGKELYEKESGFKKPVLLIFTEFFNWKKNVKRAYNYVKNAPKDFIEMITLKGTVHMDQCDVPGIMPSFLSKMTDSHSSERISFDVATEVQREIIMQYFEKYLKNKEDPVKLLDDDFKLSERFILGSNIVLDDKEDQTAESVNNTPVKNEDQADKDIDSHKL